MKNCKQGEGFEFQNGEGCTGRRANKFFKLRLFFAINIILDEREWRTLNDGEL